MLLWILEGYIGVLVKRDKGSFIDLFMDKFSLILIKQLIHYHIFLISATIVWCLLLCFGDGGCV